MNDFEMRERFETLGETAFGDSPPPVSNLRSAVVGRTRRRLTGRLVGVGAVVALLAGGLAMASSPAGGGGEVTTEVEVADHGPAPTPTVASVPVDEVVPSASDESGTAPTTSGTVQVVTEWTAEEPGPVDDLPAPPPTPQSEAPAPEEPAEPYVPYVPTKPFPVGPQRADWSFLPHYLERVTAESTSFVVSAPIPARCWRPAVLPVGPEGGLEGIVQPYVDWEDATVVVEETDEAITVTGVYEPPSAEEWYAPFEPGWFECTYSVNYTVELSSPIGDRSIYDGAELEWPLS